jgi:predicted MFS family arabinose efflux permease
VSSCCSSCRNAASRRWSSRPAFVGYEALGVATNLAGGWIGARLGLKVTLFAGLALQLAALLVLAIDPSSLTIPIVIGAQAASGVAKDLTKMSSKAWVKRIVPAGDAHGLLRWVSLLTGSKNALKGVGFFLGGALLAGVGFQGACRVLAGMIAVALLVAALFLRSSEAKVKGAGVEGLLSRDPRINLLAAARLFLFAARDAWFVVALPLYLADTLQWSSTRVGAFLAVWVIAYGAVQASAPAWVGARRAGERRSPPDGQRLALWTGALAVPLGLLAAALHFDSGGTLIVAIGLYVFGAVFAANSAVHSFLVVHYADSEAVAQRVGFYYASNAAGRLAGTLASGALYQAAGGGAPGLALALIGAVGSVLVSTALAASLARAERAAVARL